MCYIMFARIYLPLLEDRTPSVTTLSSKQTATIDIICTRVLIVLLSLFPPLSPHLPFHPPSLPSLPPLLSSHILLRSSLLTPASLPPFFLVSIHSLDKKMPKRPLSESYDVLPPFLVCSSICLLHSATLCYTLLPSALFSIAVCICSY